MVVLVSVWRFTTRRKDDAQLILREGESSNQYCRISSASGWGRSIHQDRQGRNWRLETGESY